MSAANIVFNSGIKLNYQNSFIFTAQTYIESLAKISGANEKEIFHLNMVIEEVLAFIIDKFPDDKFENYIDLSFSLLENNVIAIEMTNFGPPIHPYQIPEFDISNEETMDGLWYKMAKSIVDELEFENRKNKGWLIRIKKKIENLTFKKEESSAEEQNISQHLNVREAIPEDTAQLIDLAYNTYRYSYGISNYYDANILSKYIEEGRYYTLVIESDEKIIGAISIKHSKHNPKSAEMGAAMIMPEYRKSTALLRLIKAMDQYHRENPHGLDVIESFPVTTHTLSQRSVSKIHNGHLPFSVLLNITPSPNFIAIGNRTGARESLLTCYHLCGKLLKEKIFATETNKDIIKELLTNSKNTIRVHTDTESPVAHESEIITHTESLNDANIYIKSFGIDWVSDIRKEIFTLRTNKVESIIIRISTDYALPPNLEEKLADLNVIFNGLAIESLNNIYLSYILITEPVDFDSIQIHEPVAKNLLQHIKQRYEEVLLTRGFRNT